MNENSKVQEETHNKMAVDSSPGLSMYFLLIKPAGRVLFTLGAIANGHAGERADTFRNVQQ